MRQKEYLTVCSGDLSLGVAFAVCTDHDAENHILCLMKKLLIYTDRQGLVGTENLSKNQKSFVCVCVDRWKGQEVQDLIFMCNWLTLEMKLPYVNFDCKFWFIFY